MKAKDLRERSVEDLRELEKSLARDTFANRFKNFTNRLDDTSTINKARRDLARVKTLLRQLELNAAAAKTTATPQNAPEKSE
jgi:large subunit ribosomal protein L29